MRTTSTLAGLVVASMIAAGCGQTETARNAEEAAKSAEQGAEQAAKGLEQLARSIEQMAGGGDTKTVEPVSFRELQTAFGELEGWEKGKPTGERMSMPVNFSQAEITYRQGDARIQAKIVDSGFHQLLMAPYAMFLSAGYEKETETGYEKSVTVEGHPGWEEWNAERKDGSLNAVVNKRFLVTFDGDGIESTEPLYQLARRTDLQKLAGMK